MWDIFIFFALTALLFWSVGAYAAWKDKHSLAFVSTVMGLIVFMGYIIMMWVSLERPPLRTMGETRLWYSFFLPLAGVILYSRWKYKWVLSFSTLMALVFICINIFKPEIHSKTLMPALQSPWFAPHVIVYMFAYALFGMAALIALLHLTPSLQKKITVFSPSETNQKGVLDDLVYVGFALLTIGMLLGAVWAKDAWGHYWAWDPKETWAAITWFTYLEYIHLRRIKNTKQKYALYTLIVGFILLQMCWWGINYLPSAQGSSIHTYSVN